MPTEEKKLRRSVIKEELLALTGDYKLSIVLNQMIYWSERVRDFDQFIVEEQTRARQNNEPDLQISLQNGWIYKKAEELAQETLLGLSPSNMLRHLGQLVAKGWLDRRRNPKIKMDKTYQYRVNILQIQNDLEGLGYTLDGYPIYTATWPYFQNRNTSFQNENTSFQNENRDFQNENWSFRNETAIPEITTETTTRITSEIDDGPATPPELEPLEKALHDIDFRMSTNSGRKYSAKPGDYQAAAYLLASRIPLQSILEGIDYTFAHFQPHSFSYCAKVIAQRWTIHEEPYRPPAQAAPNAVPIRDDRYKAFYKLFPS